MPSSTSTPQRDDHVRLDCPNTGSTYPTSLSFRGSTAAMYHELERLKTYDDWPLSYMQPRAMAKAGFYYTKRRDIVRCPFCDLEVTSWEDGDDPREDHRKWNAACQFINDPEGCGNVPLPPDHPGIVFPQQPSRLGYDTCGPRPLPGVDLLTGKKANGGPGIGDVTSAPVFPSKAPSFPLFSRQDARLDSYASWPVSLKIKPDILSEAGFYYTGKGDQTICFYCGGGLKDWEDTDDPWTEHAKWFSKCTYVLLKKGEQFVENAKAMVTMHQNEKSKDGDIKSVRDTQASPTQEKPGEDIAGCSSTGGSPGSGGNDAMLCKLCYTRGLEVVFLPCGHLMSCIQCSLMMTTCGVCRQPITSVLRTFLP